MRVLLLTLLMMMGFSSSAQNFGVDTNQITFYGHPDSLEFNDGFIVQNYSGQYLSMAWERCSETLPVGWEASICDGVACRPPEIDFALYELDTAWNSALNIMHMYFYPNGISGTGTTMLKVFQWDTTASDTLYLTFHGIAVGGLGVNETPEIVVKAYPNPAMDIVQIQWQARVPILSVRIINLNGSEQRFVHSTSSVGLTLRLPDLAPGNYVVLLEHDKGIASVPLIKE